MGMISASLPPMNLEIIEGDSLRVMQGMEPNSFGSVITDPPYGLGFMNATWDSAVPPAAYWAEALRVTKPGAFLLAFGGTRTFHRLAVEIEDAGWEIRDCLMWLYGSGFPKGVSIDKAIDRAAGRAARDGWRFAGYNTALKPAWEPIILAMKPLDGTYAQNAVQHGVAGLAIDRCRIPTTDKREYPNGPGGKSHHYSSDKRSAEVRPDPWSMSALGRYPANLIHDGLEEPFARYFYCAKASKREKGEGNRHPTVKPLALMEYLCRLTIPPTDAPVLDPFCGSGTTGVACKRLGRSFVGIDNDPESVATARRRLEETCPD